MTRSNLRLCRFVMTVFSVLEAYFRLQQQYNKIRMMMMISLSLSPFLTAIFQVNLALAGVYWFVGGDDLTELIAPLVQLSPPPPSSFASINTG